MSECIIAGGGRTSYIAGPSGPAIATDLPVLNSEFPMDSSIKYNGSEYILNVIIDMYPAGCTYQWYKDNQPIIGANQSIYTFTPEDVYTTYQFHCVVSNSLGSVSSRKASITVYPTKLYILKNGVYDTLAFGKFKAEYGNGYVDDSSPYFSVSTNSSSIVPFITSSVLPTSKYDNVSITYELSNTYMGGKCILSIDVNGYMVADIYGTTVANKKDTRTRSISGVTTDEYIALRVQSNGSSYVYMYVNELYLY